MCTCNTGSDTKGILAQKRSAQSSISYSLRTLTSLTFKLKGAKEIIAKSDPISHLLRIFREFFQEQIYQ